MLISSFNCRGLRGRIKKSKVKDLIRSNFLYFIVLQETKLSEVFHSLVHSLWGNRICDWSFCPSVGSSDGLLSIWCSSKDRSLFSLFGLGFLGRCLEWGLLIQCALVLMCILRAH